MAQLSQLAQLEERRRALLARSESLRRQLDGEFENLRRPVALIEKGWAFAQSFRSAWPWMAAASGLLFARKRRSFLGTLRQAWSCWRLARKCYALWRSRSAAGEEEAA